VVHPRTEDSSQESCQIGDYSHNLVVRHPENEDERNRFTNFRLIESYINHELNILIEFRTGDGEELIANLQNAPIFGWKPSADGLVTTADQESNICVSCGEQQTVLVDVVESVQNPKRSIPSRIGLHLVDSFSSHLVHTAYLSSRSVFGIEILGFSVEDREASVFAENSTPGFYKFPCQVIQRTPKILQRIPCDSGELGIDRCHVCDVKRAVASLKITLDAQGVRVGFTERTPKGFVIANVLLGPFAFDQEVVKRMIFGDVQHPAYEEV